jgi:hypothetical protein
MAPTSDLESLKAQRALAAICEGCGQAFEPRRPNQRHCRASCRAKASRQRKAQGRESKAARFDRAVQELVAAADALKQSA